MTDTDPGPVEPGPFAAVWLAVRLMVWGAVLFGLVYAIPLLLVELAG